MAVSKDCSDSNVQHACPKKHAVISCCSTGLFGLHPATEYAIDEAQNSLSDLMVMS